MKTTISIWILEQSFLKNLLLSAAKFIMLGGLFWFNYNHINGSYFVNFVILIIFLSVSYTLVCSNEKRFNNLGEAIKYLQKKEIEKDV